MKAAFLVRALLAAVAAVAPVAVASTLPLPRGLSPLQSRQQDCSIQPASKRLARDNDMTLDTRNPLQGRQVMEGTCDTVPIPNGQCTVVTYTLMPDGNWLVCTTTLPCDGAHPCTADGNHCSWSRASGIVVCS